MRLRSGPALTVSSSRRLRGYVRPKDLLNRFLRETLKSRDVGEIFVKCFQFLVEHHEFVDIYDHNRRSVLSTAMFVDIRNRCDSLLALAAMRMHESQGIEGRRLLPGPIAKELRQQLKMAMSGGVSKEGVFPAILALLVSIESHMATLVLSSQDTIGGREWRHLIPIVSSQPFQRARPSLGITEETAPPTYGISLQHVQLESYFDVLTAPTRAGQYQPLKPVIYVPQMAPDLVESPDVLKVGLASILMDLSDIEWEMDETRFWGTQIAHDRRELARGRLNWVLQTAVKEGVNFLVIPELNLDEDLARQFEQFWARDRGADLMVAVVGLTHRAEADGLGYRNAPLVFTGSGALPWPYWKYEPVRFKFPSGDRTEALGSRPEYLAAIDTPIGRMCVLICKDALQTQILDAVCALRASLLVIPSMTSAKSSDSFLHSARLIAAANHGVTIFCNSAVHIRGKSNPEGLGFVHPNVRYHQADVPRHTLPRDDAQATLAVYSMPRSHKIASGERPAVKVHSATQDELSATG